MNEIYRLYHLNCKNYALRRLMVRCRYLLAATFRHLARNGSAAPLVHLQAVRLESAATVLTRHEVRLQHTSQYQVIRVVTAHTRAYRRPSTCCLADCD